jgi:hypothetical protein
MRFKHLSDRRRHNDHGRGYKDNGRRHNSIGRGAKNISEDTISLVEELKTLAKR